MRLLGALLALSWIGLGFPAVAAARSGPAEAPKRVAVLTPTYDGDELDESARTTLEEALVTGLERGGVELVPRDSIDASAACAEDECYQRTAKQHDATHVLEMTVTLTSRDYEIALDVHSGQSGATVASSAEVCEICGLDEVTELLSGKAATLAEQIATATSASVVAVTSVPAGATVFIDGKSVGRTPFRTKTEPGKRVVRVALADHITVERELNVSEGVRSNVEFDLEKQPGRRADPKLRPWGWGAVAGGGAFLATGIALIAVDRNEYKRRCDGGNVDADGDCKFVLNTRWAGLSLSVIGTAAIATGAAFLILTRGHQTKNKEKVGTAHAKVRVRPTFGGTSAGIIGWF